MDWTIVTVPFSFGGPKGMVQLNALRSWKLLDPVPDIMLVDDGESDLDRIAYRFDVGVIAPIECNEYGLSLRSIFEAIDTTVRTDLIAYVDTDVILGQSFAEAIRYTAQRFDQFQMCGGRWSAKGLGEIDYSRPRWQRDIWSHVFKNHHKGSDYAVYRKGHFAGMPDFTIGMGWWDGWRMGHTLRQGAALVNAERVAYAVHQDHGLRNAGSPAWGRNRQLMGDCQAWVTNATHYLTPEETGLPALRIENVAARGRGRKR